MTTQDTEGGGQRRWGRCRSWLTGPALLLIGCSSSPAQVGGCTPHSAEAGRYRVLTRQLLADTAHEITHHPLRAGATVLHDEAGWLASVGRGLFGKRIGMRLHGCPAEAPLCRAALNPALVERNVQPASVRLYRQGGEALAVLDDMIGAALCRIDVIMYTWEDDPVGWDIARRLASWAAPNRRLRILVDGGANLIFPSTAGGSTCPMSRREKRSITAGQANRVVCWLSRQPYVELLRIRNPFVHFDHRKLVLIDGRSVWAGGRNFSRPAFFVRHDVSFTLQGPLVTELQVKFENYWRDQGGRPARLDLATPPLTVNAASRLVENTPTCHTLRQALYHALDCARVSAWMENPYLCDNGIIVKLARARHRGVDVRVVLTVRSDSESINHTNRVTANRLLAAGVRVYLYPGRVHTKAATADGCWAYLGSGNFDLLSLRRNHELGVVFAPGPLIAELETILFQPDFQPEWELRAPLPLTVKDYAYELLAAFFL